MIHDINLIKKNSNNVTGLSFINNTVMGIIVIHETIFRIKKPTAQYNNRPGY